MSKLWGAVQSGGELELLGPAFLGGCVGEGRSGGKGKQGNQ